MPGIPSGPEGTGLNGPGSPKPVGEAGLPVAALVGVILPALVLGLAILLWVHYFTDWLPVVSGLATVTGVTAWSAWVAKIVPDRQRSGLAGTGLARALGRPAVVRRTAWALAGAAVAGIAVSLFRGSVLIRVTAAGGADVYVHRPGAADRGDPAQLGPGEHLVSRWVGWDGSDVVVKTPGYPDRTVTVRPWRRTTVVVPTSFYRAAVLLKPRGELTQTLLSFKKDKVTVKFAATLLDGADKPAGPEYVLDNYLGQAVWLGCDGDVPIDPAVWKRGPYWDAETAKTFESFLNIYWRVGLTPVRAPAAGDPAGLDAALRTLPLRRLPCTIRVTLLPSGGGVKRAALVKDIVVHDVHGADQFPQVEEFDENEWPISTP